MQNVCLFVSEVAPLSVKTVSRFEAYVVGINSCTCNILTERSDHWLFGCCQTVFGSTFSGPVPAHKKSYFRMHISKIASTKFHNSNRIASSKEWVVDRSWVQCVNMLWCFIFWVMGLNPIDPQCNNQSTIFVELLVSHQRAFCRICPAAKIALKFILYLFNMVYDKLAMDVLCDDSWRNSWCVGLGAWVPWRPLFWEEAYKF